MNKQTSTKLQWLKDVPAMNLTQRELQVLLCVFNYTNAEGRNAYASGKRIAEETGMNERTAERLLKKLRESGILIREHKGGRSGDGAHWASVYALGECQPDGAVPQPDGAVPQPDGGTGASNPFSSNPVPSNPHKIHTVKTSFDHVSTADAEPREATKISDDWEPNKFHKSKAEKLNLGVGEVAYVFKEWADNEDVRRSNWDSTFHALLDCAANDHEPDEKGFLNIMDYADGEADWLTRTTNRWTKLNPDDQPIDAMPVCRHCGVTMDAWGCPKHCGEATA